MQRSPKLREQLDKAAAELKAMEASTSFEELESHWKDFLSQLERFWYKSQAQFSRSPKWKTWKASYQLDREKDPLLNYLKLARAAHEHTLDDIAVKTPGSIGIGAGPTGSGTIRSLTIDKGVISADVTSGTISIKISPNRIATLPIKQRGADCPPPISHLGVSIDPENVVALGAAGYAYYDHFLKEAEAYLVTNSDV